ncbi:MAG TPA: hypothetical protein VMU58_06860 [Gaiellaceae bacterium]|nr:hypothetical protein [Gaiellaceae bacterium]
MPAVTGYLVTGEPAVGEFRCRGCGYGVIVQRALPRCPMCSGTAWKPGSWRPFGRLPLQ